jgi:hypothetical protein
MYLWAALISGCALAIAFIDGGELVIAIVAGAILVATVLPRLIRDRSPRGSDRLSVLGNGAGAPTRPLGRRDRRLRTRSRRRKELRPPPAAPKDVS